MILCAKDRTEIFAFIKLIFYWEGEDNKIKYALC